MTGQRGWQGWTSCSPAQLTAPRRMRSLERPDSLGKHFHSSRRISFFLFSIVPLCCLPLLPPPPSMSSGLLCTRAEAACGCCSRCSLGEEGGEGPCSSSRGAGDPARCSGFCSACAGPWLWEGGGHRAAPGSLWPALSLSHPWVGWQGWQLCPFPPLGHLLGTAKSAQHGRQENLYILPPNIWKSLKMEVFRVNIYPKTSLAPACVRIAVRFPLLPHCSSRLVSPGPSVGPS